MFASLFVCYLEFKKIFLLKQTVIDNWFFPIWEIIFGIYWNTTGGQKSYQNINI